MIKLIIPFKTGKKSQHVNNFEEIKEDAIAMQEALANNKFIPYSKKTHIALHHSQISKTPFDFFIINRFVVGAEEGQLVMFANAEIMDKVKESKTSGFQGCMSFPTKQDTSVDFYNVIKVTYQTVNNKGELITVENQELTGLMAQIFQHEILHGKGGTIYDGKGGTGFLKTNQQKIADRRLKKQEHWEDKEARKLLPKNDTLEDGVLPTIVANRKVCKECNIRTRAHGAARCIECIFTFNKK